VVVAYLVATCAPDPAQAARQKSSPPATVSTDAIPGAETATPKYNAKALHRLDFRVEGKSCAICLYKIQERIKDLPGAVKSEVMVKKPYGAVIIYDSSQLTQDKIVTVAKKDEPEVRLVGIKDEPIKKIPVVLIPLYSESQL
jgi:copper chaperone CopZ